ncbi:DUF5067 domain-containing protein [Geomicrobium sediminis]|uniref:DUF5067 domain-containing protein n=1 Tax=Geomicrobium sediminis TaxID=1347788 RepID=A0ABS2PF40_9BACL|nr:DUF5067 domain-containing protein [Geomicrobium sediminis]MBM7634028.1 hypothetical protein [Geomicrobium sediminis]
MKKYLLSIGLGSALLLSACGDGTDEPSDADEAEGAEEDSAADVDEDDQEELSADEDDDTANNEVNDDYLDTGDYVFEFQEVEQMENARDEETQIIAIELTFTNNSDDDTSPWMAAAQAYSSEQETDVTVESLMGANGSFPEGYKEELVNMGDTNIKPGATVDAVIGYELLYPGEDVILSERSFGNDDITFEKIIETEE